ncbi:hypothetical protein GGF31_001518 [Allomyces arbusculus]|nr:hypothetical protein GGF31_001518 [Allomyces arbusculus]
MTMLASPPPELAAPLGAKRAASGKSSGASTTHAPTVAAVDRHPRALVDALDQFATQLRSAIRSIALASENRPCVRSNLPGELAQLLMTMGVHFPAHLTKPLLDSDVIVFLAAQVYYEVFTLTTEAVDDWALATGGDVAAMHATLQAVRKRASDAILDRKVPVQDWTVDELETAAWPEMVDVDPSVPAAKNLARTLVEAAVDYLTKVGLVVATGKQAALYLHVALGFPDVYCWLKTAHPSWRLRFFDTQMPYDPNTMGPAPRLVCRDWKPARSVHDHDMDVAASPKLSSTHAHWRVAYTVHPYLDVGDSAEDAQMSPVLSNTGLYRAEVVCFVDAGMVPGGGENPSVDSQDERLRSASFDQFSEYSNMSPPFHHLDSSAMSNYSSADSLSRPSSVRSSPSSISGRRTPKPRFTTATITRSWESFKAPVEPEPVADDKDATDTDETGDQKSRRRFSPGKLAAQAKSALVDWKNRVADASFACTRIVSAERKREANYNNIRRTVQRSQRTSMLMAAPEPLADDTLLPPVTDQPAIKRAVYEALPRIDRATLQLQLTDHVSRATSVLQTVQAAMDQVLAASRRAHGVNAVDIALAVLKAQLSQTAKQPLDLDALGTDTVAPWLAAVAMAEVIEYLAAVEVDLMGGQLATRAAREAARYARMFQGASDSGTRSHPLAGLVGDAEATTVASDAVHAVAAKIAPFVPGTSSKTIRECLTRPVLTVIALYFAVKEVYLGCGLVAVPSGTEFDSITMEIDHSQGPLPSRRTRYVAFALTPAIGVVEPESPADAALGATNPQKILFPALVLCCAAANPSQRQFKPLPPVPSLSAQPSTLTLSASY